VIPFCGGREVQAPTASARKVKAQVRASTRSPASEDLDRSQCHLVVRSVNDTANEIDAFVRQARRKPQP